MLLLFTHFSFFAILPAYHYHRPSRDSSLSSSSSRYYYDFYIPIPTRHEWDDALFQLIVKESSKLLLNYRVGLAQWLNACSFLQAPSSRTSWSCRLTFFSTFRTTITATTTSSTLCPRLFSAPINLLLLPQYDKRNYTPLFSWPP